MEQRWWENAVIYQIYPKSFQDSNDDGIGDIQGIIQRLDYIQSLGVNTLWLNPIFSSPQVDNGYDVDDYFDIDPIFGTISDVEQLIEAVHQRKMKIIFDLVLNHTSRQHRWFQEALNDKESPYCDYYYFVDEKPNNWGSFFGGSVWEPTGDGRYYFHLFDKEMPDLNWKNEAVRDACLDIALFWLDKGIDGLRLDAFIHLGKADFTLQYGTDTEEAVIAEEYYANLPVVHEYIHEFATKLKSEYPNVFLIGEASSSDLETAIDYMDPKRNECDAIITFRYFNEEDHPTYKMLPSRFQPKRFLWPLFSETMDHWQTQMGQKGFPTLYWNNHDMARMVNRFGDIHWRDESQKCLATLMYLQKGIPILLYGEEIGMVNHHAQHIDDIEEFEGLSFYKEALAYGLESKEILAMMENHTRNASRGAMQWNNRIYAGFSHVAPWLGVNVEDGYNVADEEDDEYSILSYYRQLLTLKKEPLFCYGDYIRLSNEPLYAYQRVYHGQCATVYCNLSTASVPLVIDEPHQVLLSSHIQKTKQGYQLDAYGCIVLLKEEK